jgi:hypothetical protein
VEALPKGYPQGADGAREASERAHFRALRPSLGQDHRAGYRCVESWSVFERMGEEHTYPIRSQLARVELPRLSKKSGQPHFEGGRSL